MVEALAKYLASDIRETLGRQACYRWALAGGSTPGRLYRRLAQPGAADVLDWRRMRLFWGDERCVPPDDPQSNYRMVRESLLDHVPIPAGNIFPIDGTLEPERSAAAYAQVLGEEPLDCVLLGMGEDGHTASLFPGHGWGDAPDSPDVLVVHEAPKPPPERVSLSAARLNRSQRVWFVITGSGKREALLRWKSGEVLPLSVVHGEQETVAWLDAAAWPPGE